MASLTLPLRLCRLAVVLCALYLWPAWADERPNILLIISDDQSWAHTGRAGQPGLHTPHFDRLAEEGLYFERGYVTAPSCGPSRASILTGRHNWKLEGTALMEGLWPEGVASYQDYLEAAGYFTGFTGKPWGPGFFAPGQRRNQNHVTGRSFAQLQLESPGPYRGPWDLAANLEAFLAARPAGKPFSFWVGSFEPHRPFPAGDAGRFTGLNPEAVLPPILPATPRVLQEFAAYLQEIEWLDEDIGRLYAVLERHGLLENTLIIVTSDNGMDFPRGKTQNYEYGVRVPLVMRWGSGIKAPGKAVTGPVSLVHLAPTFLQLAGLPVPDDMDGRSLLPVLRSHQPEQAAAAFRAAFTANERHANHARAFNQTYPRRAIHTRDYALIRNYFPNRWPAGDPPFFIEAGLHLLQHEDGRPLEPFYTASMAKRPYQELYDLRRDPGQFNNLADDPAHARVLRELSALLDAELMRTGDPVHVQRIDYFGRFEPAHWRKEPKTVYPGVKHLPPLAQ